MWDFINNFFKEKSGNKKKKVIVILIFIMLIISVLFPYIDANYFYYDRMEKRIEILEKVSEIDIEKISKNEKLEKEYSSIIDEIEYQNKNSTISIGQNENSNNIKVKKIIYGGIIWWSAAIIILIGKRRKPDEDKKKFILNKMMQICFCIIIGLAVGIYSINILSIINVWINYLAFPMLVFLIFIIVLIIKE